MCVLATALPCLARADDATVEGALRVVLPDGRVLAGARLAGAELVLADGAGSRYEVRIEACPRLEGRTGPACAPGQDAAAGALLFNRSRP